MVAYIVLVREETTNPDRLQAYAAKARDTFAGHAVTPLVSNGNFEMLEGDPIERVAIVSFPTTAEAKAWYESPAYQEAARQRRACAKYRGFIVEGI